MSPFVGSHVKRVEDPRLLRGESRYVDDLGLPGMLHLVFVRSAYAHARLAEVDVDAARAGAGVAAVLTDALAPLGVGSLDTPLRPERIWRVMRS